MTKEKITKAITGATLIDGTGTEPVRDVTILVEDNLIYNIGVGIEVPDESEIIDASGMVVMPGLIDAHVHFCLNGDPKLLLDMIMRPPGLIMMIAARNAMTTLEAGVTTVRDAGDLDYFCISLKQAIEMGIARGSRIVASGKPLSQTGGHGDSYLPSRITIPFGGHIVDGPDAVRRATREVLREGADWVKICTSGGVASPADPVDTPQFTLDEIRVVVEEAAAVGKGVLSHAHGTTGIKNAVLAGVRTIEHGTIMTEEVAGLMVEKSAYHVPTLAWCYWLLKCGREGGVPEFMVAKAEQIADYPARSMMISHKAGVKIAMGTDSGTPFQPHGLNAKELELMVNGGLEPMEAIVASTKTGAEAIGLGDKTGILEKGRWADLIVVDGDPLRDITVLQDKQKIKLVMKGGVVEVNRGF